MFEATPHIFARPTIKKAGKYFRTQPRAAPPPVLTLLVCFGRHTRTEHAVPTTAWLAGQRERRTQEDVTLPAFL